MTTETRPAGGSGEAAPGARRSGPAGGGGSAGEVLAITDEGLGNTADLVDLGDGRALAVDPSRDPAGRLRAAAAGRGLRVAFVAETHLHADFVSGATELAAQGAEVLASAAGGREFAHRGLGDGDEVDLGGLRLRALATPGHTPEHLAYLLLDGATPLALFSGGSLLVGTVARTDLVSPERTEELARAMFRSVRALMELPDALPVHPTHGAGSFCAAPAGAERSTTVGRERARNPLASAPDEDSFVARLLAGLGSHPPYFMRLPAINRRGPRVYEGPPSLAQLAPAAVGALQRRGAELVDVRPAADFAAGHIPGAISIELRAVFASWLGWLVEADRPLVFVAGPGQDRADLVGQALRVGFENLAGELAGGMAAWRAAGRRVQATALIGPGSLAGSALVDVRQAAEYRAGHIPGALSVELGALASAPAALPPGPLTVTCGAVERAMSGASLLERAGRGGVSVLAGGTGGWAAATGRGLAAGG